MIDNEVQKLNPNPEQPISKRANEMNRQLSKEEARRTIQCFQKAFNISSVREMQTKTILRHLLICLTPGRTDLSKRPVNKCYWGGWGKRKLGSLQAVRVQASAAIREIRSFSDTKREAPRGASSKHAHKGLSPAKETLVNPWSLLLYSQ